MAARRVRKTQTFKETPMSESTFDPKTIFDSYRNAIAPALKVQQEGVKALEGVGRYQYAVAGDYLEWSLAQAKAAVAAQSPAEFVSRQVELTTALSERLRARAQEFVKLAADAQTSFSGAVNESVSKVAAETKKKAS
jgi:phasin family protein